MPFYYFFQREVHAILPMEKLRIEHAGTIKNCFCKLFKDYVQIFSDYIDRGIYLYRTNLHENKHVFIILISIAENISISKKILKKKYIYIYIHYRIFEKKIT